MGSILITTCMNPYTCGITHLVFGAVAGDCQIDIVKNFVLLDLNVIFIRVFIFGCGFSGTLVVACTQHVEQEDKEPS